MRTQHTGAPRFRTSSVRQFAFVVVLAAACSAPAADLPRWFGGALRLAPVFDTSFGNPTPPPPASAAHWRKFLALYTAFKQAHGARSSAHQGIDPDRFGRWVVLHGVTDPVEIAIMVNLYLWIERAGAV